MSSEILRFQQAITSREWLLAVSLGLVEGVESVIKFGHCPNAGITPTDVWEFGGTTPIYIFPPDTGEALEMVGLAAGDVGIPVIIEGCGADGLFRTDSKILNGIVPVALDGVWSAIHRAYNDAPEGPGNLFTNLVKIRTAGGGGNDYAVMDADDQQTSQAVFKVPSNRIAMVLNFSNAINKDAGGPNVGAINRLRIANKDKNFRSRVYFGLQQLGTSNLTSDAILPLITGPWARIKAQTEPNTADMDISSEYSLLLMDTEFFSADFITALQST